MKRAVLVVLFIIFTSATAPVRGQIPVAPDHPSLEAIRLHLAGVTGNMQRSEQIDTIREFVYTHRERGDGEPYGWNIPVILDMIWEYEQGNGPKPAITCGADSLVLQAILDRFDIQNRLIAMFTDAGTALSSHTFLEVFNYELGQWEVHDPTFGCQFVATTDRRRLSVKDLLFMDLTLDVVPTSARGDGWDENGVAHLRDVGYLSSAVFHTRGEQTPPWRHWILVNKTRFDPDKVYPDTGESWRDWAKVRYRGALMFETDAADTP